MREGMLNQIFISYRHESPQHAERVRWLAEQLRSRGLTVALDQFLLEASPGGPPEKWSTWSLRQAADSSCVLIVGSPGWYAAYSNPESLPENVGLGAAAEAHVILERLYQLRWRTDRHRVVLLDEADGTGLPLELRGWRWFKPLTSTRDLDDLIAWASRAVRLADPVGDPVEMDWPSDPRDFDHGLADRSAEEWTAIRTLLTCQANRRILFLEGASGLGKSALVAAAEKYARELGAATAVADFVNHSLLDETNLLRELRLGLSRRAASFAVHLAPDRWAFRELLRGMKKPVFIALDGYERTRDQTHLASWIETQLLPEESENPRLRFLVSGQSFGESLCQRWADRAGRLAVKPLADVLEWNAWLRRFECPITGTTVSDLVSACDGSPALISSLLRSLIRKRQTRPPAT